MPAKVTKKVVNNVSFITSLEQIDDYASSLKKKKKSIPPKIVSPKAEIIQPLKKREESPVKISP